MQSSRLVKCVGSDLHCGLYFQWQLSFRSLCNPVLVCFFLVLLWVLIKPSGAVCRHRRWFPGLPGASRTSSAEGCGQKPLCLCLLMPLGGGTGIVIFHINNTGSHGSRTRTGLSAFRAASVHHCLNLWKLLCGLLVFISLEFTCLFLGTSNHSIWI